MPEGGRGGHVELEGEEKEFSDIGTCLAIYPSRDSTRSKYITIHLPAITHRPPRLRRLAASEESCAANRERAR